MKKKNCIFFFCHIGIGLISSVSWQEMKFAKCSYITLLSYLYIYTHIGIVFFFFFFISKKKEDNKYILHSHGHVTSCSNY